MPSLTRARPCARCQTPLPALARSYRRFCSSRCRKLSWEALNRPTADETGGPLDRVRLHWHVGVMSMLTGDVRAGYWRGDGCPPECRGVTPPAWSTGVPVGREGFPPPDRTSPRHAVGVF